jgi:hypothetical protein
MRARGDGAQDFQGDIGSAGFVDGVAISTSEACKLVIIHPTPADQAGLANYWAFDQTDEDDGVPGTLYDQVGSVDGTTGSALTWANRNVSITVGGGSWESTLSGGFRTINGLHGGGNRTRQFGWGHLVSCAVTWIDNRGHDYSSVDSLLGSAIVGQFHFGTAKEVLAVEEGGVVIPDDGTQYYLDASNGIIYWDVSGNYPIAPVRITFKGAAVSALPANNYSENLGQFIRDALHTNWDHLSTGAFPTASVTNFSPEFPYKCNLLIPGGKERALTVGEFLKEALPLGTYWSTDLPGSVFILGKSTISPVELDALTPDVTLTDTKLERITTTDTPRRLYKLRVGYSKRHSTIGDNDVLLSVQRSVRNRLTETWSYATITDDSVDPRDGRELTVTTPISNQADALQWAQVLMAALNNWYSIQVNITRHQWEGNTARTDRGRPDVISVQSEYFPIISAATNFLLLGYRYISPKSGTAFGIQWDLWRPL